MEIVENHEHEKLNDDWINNFENIDKLYQDFYKDNLYYTNIHYVYINKSNEIDKIKNESFLMSIPNFITREEIIKILKTNCTIDGSKRYSLLYILKYNISLDVEEVTNFLNCEKSDFYNYNTEFLTTVKNIDAIHFEKTINMFQDLNDLFFIFQEKTIDPNKQFTKKIYLRQSNRKTIKK
jgi:hypothetical protein